MGGCTNAIGIIALSLTAIYVTGQLAVQAPDSLDINLTNTAIVPVMSEPQAREMSETVQPATVTSIPPSQAPTRAAATRVPPTVTPQPAYTVKTISPPMTRQTLGKVNLRQGPGTAYALAGAVSENSMLQIIGESGDWYQISLNGQEVFIASWLTYDLPTAAPTAIPASNSATNVRRFASPQRRYTHGQVNLRSGPGTTFGKIGAVAAGASLQVLGQSGDWYLINHNGRDAFIANWLTYDSPLQAASRQQPAQQQPCATAAGATAAGAAATGAATTRAAAAGSDEFFLQYKEKLRRYVIM